MTVRPVPGWLLRVREYEARQARTQALRAELAAAREAGKRARHAERLRRDRGGHREESAMTAAAEIPGCPGCGGPLEETDTEVDPWALVCVNDECNYDG